MAAAATPSRNMPAMTCEIFVHTSNYMKYLIDEISKIPEERLPHGVKQISDELIQSLVKFSGRSPKMVSGQLQAARPKRRNLPVSQNCSGAGSNGEGTSPANNVVLSPAKNAGKGNPTVKKTPDPNRSSGQNNSDNSVPAFPNKSKVVLINQHTPRSGYDSASLPSLSQTDFPQNNCLPPSGFGNAVQKPVPRENQSLSETDLSSGNSPDKRYVPNKKSISLASSSTNSPKGDFTDTQSLNNELLRRIDFSSMSTVADPKESEAASARDSVVSSEEKSHSSMDSLNATQNKIKIKKNRLASTFYITSAFCKLLESIMNSFPVEYFFYCRFCNIQINSQDEWDEHIALSHPKMNARFKSEQLSCDKCRLVVFGSKNLMTKYMSYHDYIIHNDAGSENNTELWNQLQKNIAKGGSVKVQADDVNCVRNDSSETANSAKKNKNRTKKKKANKGENDVKANEEESVGGNEAEGARAPEEKEERSNEEGTESPTKKNKKRVKKKKADKPPAEEASCSNDGGPTPVRCEEPESGEARLGPGEASHDTLLRDFIREAGCPDKIHVNGFYCCLCHTYTFCSFSWLDHLDSPSHAANSRLAADPQSTRCDKCKLSFLGELASVKDCIKSHPHVVHDTLFNKLTDPLMNSRFY